MFKINGFPIHEPGNLELDKFDKEILTHMPPTDETLQRAGEIGTFLGGLLAGNRQWVGETNLAQHILADNGVEAPYEINRTLADASHVAYETQLWSPPEVIGKLRGYWK